MKNIREEAIVWIQLGTFVVLWALVLIATRTKLEINWEAIKKLPDVVMIYGILYLIFAKWAWRWRVFRGWLVPFPDLQGTWQGHLQTTWRNPETNEIPGPIPVSLVIRQDFSGISIVMFTAESMSHSTAASFRQAEDHSIKVLSYTYSNTPKVGVRDRSIVHDGAALLRIVNDGVRRLEGEYWTNRKSTGEMVLKFNSKTLDERFRPGTDPSHLGKVSE
jgi:hypothetical protein